MADSQLELIRRIASVVGHELRNPMAVINNSAYFVKAKLSGAGSLDPKVAKHLGIMESEISRADRLIGDMLTYSRKCEPNAESQPLDPAVQSAVKSFAAPEGGKVELKLGAKDAKAKFDSAMLAQALHRLIDNGFAAQEEKGTVKVATGTDKSGVYVAVSDSGAGVDAKVADTLWEPFVTTKPRGLGLGLSLARKLLEANGGSASHESTPKGSTFRLNLPKA